MTSLLDCPFKTIAADIFQVNNISYLTIVCRYSGWLSLFKLQKNDSQQVMSILRKHLSQWGIAAILTTDVASVSQNMELFLTNYGVSHRVSS